MASIRHSGAKTNALKPWGARLERCTHPISVFCFTTHKKEDSSRSPPQKIRALAIPKQGVAIPFPQRSARNIDVLLKLNGCNARCAEQCTTSKTAYQMQKSHRKRFGHTVQAMLFPAYLLTGVERFKYILGINQQQSNAYGLRPSHKSQRSRRRFKV